jgi:two-component system chemotaxis response regulator CheY
MELLDGRQIGDVNMPVMNGIEFVCAAKALAAYKLMPILMLAAESEAKRKRCNKARLPVYVTECASHFHHASS